MTRASIIIPVYNKEKYLEETLKSVDKQTVNDVEVIIIDDQSTDHSMDIISDFKSNTKKKQVKIIQNDRNMGVSYSRNIGIEESSSDYITFLDADDLLDKDFMKIMLAKMRKYPDLDFVRGELCCFYNTPAMDRCKNTASKKDKIIRVELEPDYIRSENYSANGKLYRKDSIQNLKFVDGPFEDYEFVLNVLASCKQLLFINEAGYHYRLVDDGRYISNTKNPNNFLAYLDIWERFKSENPSLYPDIMTSLWNWHFVNCRNYLARNIDDLLSDKDFYEFRERYYSCLNYYHELKEVYQIFVTYPIESKEELEKQKQKLKEIAMKY